MDTESNNNSSEKNRISLSFGEIVDFVWRLRFWILASVCVAMLIAFFYVRMQNPVYKRDICVMLNNERSSGGENSMLAELTGAGTRKRVDNEIYILQSNPMMEKVVEELDLNTRYYHYVMPVANGMRFCRGLFAKKKVEYYRNSPFLFNFEVDPLYPEELQPTQFSVEFKNKKGSGFEIKKIYLNGKPLKLDVNEYQYGQTIPLVGASFTISVEDADNLVDRDRYICTWNTAQSTAKLFANKLSIENNTLSSNRVSDVITVSINDVSATRAADILNVLMVKVNDEAHAYGNQNIINTIDFIDQRLLSISRELVAAETDYKQFQRANTVIDLGSQSQATIAMDRQYQDQLNEVNLQLQLLDMVSENLNSDASGNFGLIPANIGVSDAGLNSIIADYNQMVTERNRMISNSSESNPRVVSMGQQLEGLKKSIEISVANLVKMYNLRQKELDKNMTIGKSQMADIPQQQFELQQLNRRLEVIEPLYLMLQQKREEAQLQIYSQMDNFRILERATGDSAPIAPNATQIYLVALVLGAVLPILLVWLRMQLRTTVENKNDVTSAVDASVLAILPRCDEGSTLIKMNGRDILSESFRNLRTNMQYLTDAKVIQVTSSIPGEGKTFVASNLALSISHLGKKILLIGMDIRKPKLMQLFPTNSVNKNNTVVGYLIGKCSNLDLLVNHAVEYENVDIIYAGPVPPNPTELLTLGKQAEIISYFRDKYDCIIIDSAPYLPVSDSFLINKFVDATIYTIRAYHTPLAMLNDIDDSIKSVTKPMKRVSLVLNGMDVKDFRYRYGYGNDYGYGYGNSQKNGYGYGYGYGYSDDDSNAANKLQRIYSKFQKTKENKSDEMI